MSKKNGDSGVDVALAFHVGPAREAAAGDLERMGPAVRSECDRLPVQDREPAAAEPTCLHDLGHAIGHVGERSRRTRAPRRRRCGPGGGCRRASTRRRPDGSASASVVSAAVCASIGYHGAKDGEPEAIETCLAASAIAAAATVNPRSPSSISALDPNLRGGTARRRRPRSHRRFPRARPAGASAHQERRPGTPARVRSLVRTAPRLRAPGFRLALAGSAPYPLERGVHLERLEGGSDAGGGRSRSDRPADADRTLRQPARKVGHRDRYLLRAKVAEARRDELGLGLARACLSRWPRTPRRSRPASPKRSEERLDVAHQQVGRLGSEVPGRARTSSTGRCCGGRAPRTARIPLERHRRTPRRPWASWWAPGCGRPRQAHRSANRRRSSCSSRRRGLARSRGTSSLEQRGVAPPA